MFLQYFNNLDGFTSEVLDAPVKFREFRLSEVVEDVYISVNSSLFKLALPHCQSIATAKAPAKGV